MSTVFQEIKRNFGFGTLRLPVMDGEIDISQMKKMVDLFMESGFHYFDTAHGYLDGKAELAIRECLSARYPRESFVLTDKLSINYFEEQEDIRPLFQKQLDACGVEYFDFYLMHAQNAQRFQEFKRRRAYETVLELIEEGKVKHLGISFHDKPDVLDQILTEYPQIEVVQIQFNYLDYLDEKVQSKNCYDVCRKHGKPIIIMEPVKGGALINLPEDAQKVFDQLNGGSNASYAIRYAASFEGVFMVLSGMSNLAQVQDNICFMANFEPLNPQEYQAVEKVSGILRRLNLIPCTACRYCTEVCPQNIAIPEILACLNDKRQGKAVDLTEISGGTPEACVQCGQCEKICPQGLKIRTLLETAALELK